MEKSQSANNYEQQKKRGLKRKWEIIQERGAQCERCGYNKNIAALEFHHRDASEKDFGVDMRTFSNTNLETLRLELDKCDMLCANCHREEHNPDLSFDNVIKLIKDIDKTSFENLSGQVCPVCRKRFPKSTGKIYCSPECKQQDKGYPSLLELEEQYKILKSWEKVGLVFNISRKVIAKIRKDENKKE